MLLQVNKVSVLYINWNVYLSNSDHHGVTVMILH